MQIGPLSGADGDGHLQQGLGRQRPGHQCVSRRHHHRCLSPGQGIQRRQTAAFPLPGGNRAGPELPLPGQKLHRLLFHQGAQISGQLPDLPLVAADKHRRAARPPGHRSAHTGSLHRLQSADRRRAAALFHPADQFRRFRNRLQLLQELFHGHRPCKKMEIYEVGEPRAAWRRGLFYASGGPILPPDQPIS